MAEPGNNPTAAAPSPEERGEERLETPERSRERNIVPALAARTHEQVESDLLPQLPRLLTRAITNFAIYRRTGLGKDDHDRMIGSLLEVLEEQTERTQRFEDALRFYNLTDGQGGRDARDSLRRVDVPFAMHGMIAPQYDRLRAATRELLDPLLRGETIAPPQIDAVIEAARGLPSELLQPEEAYERFTTERTVTALQRRRTDEWKAIIGSDRPDEVAAFLRDERNVQAMVDAFKQLQSAARAPVKGLPANLADGTPFGMPEYDLPIALLHASSVDNLRRLAEGLSNAAKEAANEERYDESRSLGFLSDAVTAYCDQHQKDPDIPYRYNLLHVYNHRKLQVATKYVAAEEVKPKSKWKEHVAPTFRHVLLDRPMIGLADLERQRGFTEAYLDTIGFVPERLYLSHPKFAEVVSLEDIAYVHDILKAERDAASTARDPERKARAQHARAQLLRHFFERGISATIDRVKENARVFIDKTGVRLQIGSTLNAHIPYPYISGTMIDVLQRETWLTAAEIEHVRANRARALGDGPID